MNRKKINLMIIIILLLSVTFTLPACIFGNEEGGEKIATLDKEPILLSDYSLPENFALTIQIADSAIFNPGEPWYYKTAKIGNDWQIIQYDRDLADLTKQATYYFGYISDDNYNRYTYDFTNSVWVANGIVDFEGLMATSYNNFKFLYEKPTETTFQIDESTSTYDVDHTSAETFIDSIKYEYTDYFETEVIVDADYLNVCLYKCEEADRPLTFRAYEYSTSISSWDSTYLQYRNYKTAP